MTTDASNATETEALAVLELNGIHHRFDDLVALDDVSLRVHAGRVHGVIGENGAGKTTLMNVAAGLIRPDAGVIRVDGRAVRFRTPKHAVAAGIAMVHQHFMLVDALTGIENLIIGRRGHGVRARRAAVSAKLAEIAGRLQLEVDPNARVGDLTVGQRQRVEIMRALLGSPRVVILDEPTAVLTPQETQSLFAAIRRLRDGGTAIVFISHKLDEVRAICDHVTVLRGGRRVWDGEAADIAPAEMARHIVGGDVPARPRPIAREAGGSVRLRLDRVSAADLESGRRLDGVSLSLVAGEITGVAGVEGNGQDLLARVALGLTATTRGRVLIDEVDVTRRSVRERLALGLALVPEDRLSQALIPEFSVAENYGLTRFARPPFSFLGLLDWLAIRNHSADAMGRFHIRAPGPRTPVERLSGGNQQRLVVARALDGKPGVIVAHNPTRGLDVAASAYVTSQLVAARNRGAAVLLINSDLDELLAVADRVCVLYRGRLISTNWPVTTRGDIGALMLRGDRNAQPSGAGTA